MAEGFDLSRSLEGGSDFIYENECVHCRKYSDSSEEAKVFCEICRQYFCGKCGFYHVRNFTTHQLMDMSTMLPTQLIPSSSQSQPVGTNKKTTLKQRKKYTMRSSCKVNVKVKSDKETCLIYDMCQLSDGTILLIDYRNNKLKRIVDTNNEKRLFLFKSASYRVKDFLEFKSSPAGICFVSSSEVAVRMWDNTIQFISVNESLSVKRQVSINHLKPFYYGLACCSDQFWVPGEGGVYVYSLFDGSLLKKIETDSQGRKLFPNSPGRIAFSNDGSKVYVTAWKDRVVVFNKNGDYIREIRDKRLYGTCGICITCDDIVLVSGYESSYCNVLMFDMKGAGLGQIDISNDMSGFPLSLCFDRPKCRLLVGIGFNKDTIHMFDLGW